jgi:hypothetical protein
MGFLNLIRDLWLGGFGNPNAELVNDLPALGLRFYRNV